MHLVLLCQNKNEKCFGGYLFHCIHGIFPKVRRAAIFAVQPQYVTTATSDIQNTAKDKEQVG